VAYEISKAGNNSNNFSQVLTAMKQVRPKTVDLEIYLPTKPAVIVKIHVIPATTQIKQKIIFSSGYWS